MLTILLRCIWCLFIGTVFLFAQPVFLSATDRAARISLYNSTAGDSWTDNTEWKDAPTLADGFNSDSCVAPLWFGVTCDGNSVTNIHLWQKQLTGPIPQSLGNLSNLEWLALDSNQLTGEVPNELGNLSNLDLLSLDNNQRYTDNNMLRAFITSERTVSDWERTQTLHSYFAQFADGAGALASQILLMNLSGEKTATAQITLRDDDGAPLTVDLNGETVLGDKEVEIVASGLEVLKTDGVGDLVVGSVSVTSDQPLAGVIIFSGSAVGTAGVGSSAAYEKGFVAPMEVNTGSSIQTGVAMMNLETEELPLTAELLGADGTLLDTVNLTLPAQGHKAVFLDELGWSSSTDLSVFEGILRVSTNGNISATVIQTRPGQFATMPVAANPGN